MKLRILIASCFVALLAGCMSFVKTGVLVTPIGVAGIHSFAPPRTPDNIDRLERTAARIAAKDTEAARAKSCVDVSTDSERRSGQLRYDCRS